jgi:hypothetical protein
MYGTAIDDDDDKSGTHTYIAWTVNAIISNQFYLRVKLFNVVYIERITIKHRICLCMSYQLW